MFLQFLDGNGLRFYTLMTSHLLLLGILLLGVDSHIGEVGNYLLGVLSLTSAGLTAVGKMDQLAAILV